MFPMTVSLTISNKDELHRFTAALVGQQIVEVNFGGGAQLSAKVEPKKTGKAPTPPPAPAEADKAGDVSPDTVTPASENLNGKTLDDAKALTMKVVAAKGRDAAVELLAKFGVKVAAKLEAGQVDAFCAEAEAVLNA